MGSYLLLIAAAFGAGLVNSVAGGGSFLTFPALVFTGVPSVIANASSTAALLPGTLSSAWVYRDDLRKSGDFPLRPMVAVSVAGGIAGALLLLYTPQRTFDTLIPWLMLGSTLLLAFGPRISPALNRIFHIGPAVVIGIQFLVAIYGGYFGGAIGILMLAAWSLFGLSNIHMMNANKTLLGAVMNGAAVVLFVLAHKIWWPQTLAMMVVAIAGGYFGATAAKRVNPNTVRMVVCGISLAVTILFFVRRI